MTVMSGVSTVDMSGTVSSLLRQYLAVLEEYRRQVTGAPDALQAIGEQHTSQAERIASVIAELDRNATGLAGDWQGMAFRAFGSATGNARRDAEQIRSMLTSQAEVLAGAATALRTARSALDSLIAQFQKSANDYAAQCTAVPVTAVNQVITQAINFGDSTVETAKKIHQQLGQTLAQLAQRLPVPPTVPAASTLSPEAARQAGQQAGQRLRDALADEKSPDAARAALTELKTVVDRATAAKLAGQPVSASDAAFLKAFYGTVGDKLTDVPAYVGESEHEWNQRFFGLISDEAPGYDQATRQSMLTSLGNGLVLLSDDGKGGMTNLPSSVQQLLNSPATESHLSSYNGYSLFGPNTFSESSPADLSLKGNNAMPGGALYAIYDVPELSKYDGLRQMLTASDPGLVGGKEFSTDLTNRVSEIAGVESRIQANDPSTMGDTPLLRDKPYMDDMMGDLLGVSTRNHEANADVLADRTAVSNLFRYDWTDSGQSASGLINWIGADAAAPGGPEHTLGQQAYSTLSNTMTEGHDPLVPLAANQTSQLPPGLQSLAASKDMSASMSIAMATNPELSTSLAQATTNNLDLIANSVDERNPAAGPVGVDNDNSWQMMKFSQYTADGRHEIAGGVEAYNTNLLQRVDAGQMSPQGAAITGGNLSGAAAAGAHNALLQQGQDLSSSYNAARQAEYQREYALAKFAVDNVGASLIRQVPGVAGDLSFLLYDKYALVEALVPRPEPAVPLAMPRDLPDPITNGDATYSAAYNIARYGYDNGQLVPVQAVVPTVSDGKVIYDVPQAYQVSDAGHRDSVLRWANGVNWMGESGGARQYIDEYGDQATVRYSADLQRQLQYTQQQQFQQR